MLVVDACVVTALLTGHPASPKIAELMRKDDDLSVPAHLDAEVLSALRGRMLGGHLTEEDLRTASARLASLPALRVSLDNARLLGRAARFFRNLSAYDALYLALANEEGAALLTGDGALAATAARARVSCLHIDCSA